MAHNKIYRIAILLFVIVGPLFLHVIKVTAKPTIRPFNSPSFLSPSTSSEQKYYVGIGSNFAVNGVSANISTPSSLNITVDGAGQSNWVSTIQSDSYGFRKWLQAGWRYYKGYNSPKQYYEYCLDCKDDAGSYYINDTYADANLGSNLEYKVTNKTGNTWCTYTAGIERECFDWINGGPVSVQVSSEIHGSFFVPLDTQFSSVSYKSVTGNTWKTFSNGNYFVYQDTPYAISFVLASKFNTFLDMSKIHNIFLPLITH